MQFPLTPRSKGSLVRSQATFTVPLELKSSSNKVDFFPALIELKYAHLQIPRIQTTQRTWHRCQTEMSASLVSIPQKGYHTA